MHKLASLSVRAIGVLVEFFAQTRFIIRLYVSFATKFVFPMCETTSVPVPAGAFELPGATHLGLELSFVGLHVVISLTR